MGEEVREADGCEIVNVLELELYMEEEKMQVQGFKKDGDMAGTVKKEEDTLPGRQMLL